MKVDSQPNETAGGRDWPSALSAISLELQGIVGRVPLTGCDQQRSSLGVPGAIQRRLAPMCTAKVTGRTLDMG